MLYIEIDTAGPFALLLIAFYRIRHLGHLGIFDWHWSLSEKARIPRVHEVLRRNGVGALHFFFICLTKLKLLQNFNDEWQTPLQGLKY